MCLVPTLIKFNTVEVIAFKSHFSKINIAKKYVFYFECNKYKIINLIYV